MNRRPTDTAGPAGIGAPVGLPQGSPASGSVARWGLSLLATAWVILSLPTRAGESAQASPVKVKDLTDMSLENLLESEITPINVYGNPRERGNLLGTIPFPEAMDVLDGKVVQGRKLRVRRINSVADATKCRVLYVGSSEKGQLAQMTESFKDKPILTVGEVDGFAQKGGMVNLLNGPDRIVMEINRVPATQPRIEFSSQLVRLARLVSR